LRRPAHQCHDKKEAQPTPNQGNNERISDGSLHLYLPLRISLASRVRSKAHIFHTEKGL